MASIWASRVTTCFTFSRRDDARGTLGLSRGLGVCVRGEGGGDFSCVKYFGTTSDWALRSSAETETALRCCRQQRIASAV